MTTIAVIEWASDDAEAPAVYVGTEEYVALAAAIAMHNRMDGDPAYDEVLDRVGVPDVSTPDVWEWHREVHETHTSPWVTFYSLANLHHGHEALPDNTLNRRLLGVTL